MDSKYTSAFWSSSRKIEFIISSFTDVIRLLTCGHKATYTKLINMGQTLSLETAIANLNILMISGIENDWIFSHFSALSETT